MDVFFLYVSVKQTKLVRQFVPGRPTLQEARFLFLMITLEINIFLGPKGTLSNKAKCEAVGLQKDTWSRNGGEFYNVW